MQLSKVVIALICLTDSTNVVRLKVFEAVSLLHSYVASHWPREDCRYLLLWWAQMVTWYHRHFVM